MNWIARKRKWLSGQSKAANALRWVLTGGETEETVSLILLFLHPFRGSAGKSGE
jgi:hypothetical protein